LERNPLHETALRVLHSCRRALGRDESPIAVAPPRAKPFFINPVVKTLVEDEASFPKAASAETGRFLYSFIRCCRPRVVAETGARLGYLSLCMGQALEDNGMGHLHAFGMFNDRPDYVSPVVGCCPNTLAASRAHVSHAGLSHRVTFHKGDSSAGLRALAEKEIDQIDLAFVDGDHSLEGCLKDWLAVDSVLRSGGFVILHDTIPQTSGWLGPRYVLEEVDARAGGQYRSINLPTCEGAGLGIIQKYSPASSPSWRPSFSDIVKAWLHRHRFW
ncbi:class I SAM-dependent methyltransferase, partial [Candidatus Poribacteria bacterium]|nr:class I SAM-dependent methyltransferase [Candidatus Poribacteria bacterium]